VARPWISARSTPLRLPVDRERPVHPQGPNGEPMQ
jgi:hypothetical protein